MPLLEELPKELSQTLAAHRNGTGDLPLQVAVQSDRVANGDFGSRWLVADSKALRVYTVGDTGKSSLDLTLPLVDVESVRDEAMVGGGSLFAVRKDTGDTIELLRYGTSLAGNMAGVARVLHASAKGEPLPEDADTIDDRRVCPKCGRPLPKNNGVCQACLNQGKTLARLFQYATEKRGLVVLLAVLMIAGTAAQLAPGVVVRHLTDDVLVARPGATSQERLSTLPMLVFALVASQLLAAGITIIRGRLSSYLSNSITLRLRTDLFNHLQKLGLSFYDKRQSGALLARVTQDVTELNNFLVDGLQFLVVNGLAIVGIVGILMYYNPLLTFLVILPLPIVIFVTRLTWRFLRRYLERMWHLRSVMTAALNSTLSGTRVVKAFAQEDREKDRFQKRVGGLYDVSLKVDQNMATVFPLLGFLMSAGSFVVWYIGGSNVVNGLMTLGTFQMFLFFLGQLYGPLQQMTRIADWLSRAVTAAERVFEILDTEADVQDTAEAKPLQRIEGAIKFENVSFGYDKVRRVLDGVDLDVKPGEMIGLVGHSGAGKTTIINLISRFYDPTEGRILIDGQDMKNIKLNDLRRQLGIVLQEPFLFPGTIADNIAYANPEASPEEIMRAAKAANAHEFVMRFPDGYDTQVGERGVRLSGGERQRLSIARAILHNPRILILDEATASVDTETEAEIQQAIQRLISGRTTFAIAHRLSTLRNADRLVVMDKGKVAEVGTHDELMNKENGIFRRLVDMQLEINKLRVLEG
jgi:ATP-binding cassette subfamily B protein